MRIRVVMVLLMVLLAGPSVADARCDSSDGTTVVALAGFQAYEDLRVSLSTDCPDPAPVLELVAVSDDMVLVTAHTPIRQYPLANGITVYEFEPGQRVDVREQIFVMLGGRTISARCLPFSDRPRARKQLECTAIDFWPED